MHVRWLKWWTNTDGEISTCQDHNPGKIILYQEASHLLSLDPSNTCCWAAFNCLLVWVINTFLLLRFPNGLRPSPVAKLMSSQWQRKRQCFLVRVYLPQYPVSDQGTHFSGRNFQAFMKSLQTSWNYHNLYHPQPDKVKKTNEILKISQLETTGPPWPLILWTKQSTPFGKQTEQT